VVLWRRTDLDRDENVVTPARIGALVLVCAFLGACAPILHRQAQAIDVRLQAVARTLAVAASSGPQAPALRSALDDAQQSLFDAENAIASWERGDPRPWSIVRPCLAEDLERVDAALAQLERLPPPGLTQLVTRSPREGCADTRYRH
jgi:hypothetical protein